MNSTRYWILKEYYKPLQELVQGVYDESELKLEFLKEDDSSVEFIVSYSEPRYLILLGANIERVLICTE